jgi:hypothetical protein
LNYGYVGAGYRYKDFSIGFNFGYLFGTLHSSSIAQAINDTNSISGSYVANFTNYRRLGGLHWKGGLMYEHKIDSGYTLRAGGTLTLGQNLNERLSAYEVSIYNFGDTIVNDTSAYSGESRGKLKLPLAYSLGVMLVKNNKWGLGLDYTATQWSNFSSTVDSNITLNIAKSAYRISLGGELTPDANSIRGYFSRVTYRAGFYYGKEYFTFQGNQLPVYGVTVGASLPFRRSFSHLHTSLEVGRVGLTTNNLIQETYVRFTLGLSFNDLWFIKRKYD